MDRGGGGTVLLSMLAGLRTSSDRGGGKVGSTLDPQSLLTYVSQLCSYVFTIALLSPADKGLNRLYSV